MNSRYQPSLIAWRFYLILVLVSLAVAGLAFRVFDLAVLNQHFLMHQGNERALRKISTPAFRGMIVDRNGYPLAVSTRVFSAWINPLEFTASNDQLKSLGKLIDLKPKEMLKLVARESKRKREFAYLKRSLSPETANLLKAMHIEGLYTQAEYRRYYPEGEVTAHVVGFTNVDDKGQEGLELAYNGWLLGEAGKKLVVKDRLGRVISEIREEQEQKPGHDLTLSLDRRIQYLAYRELLAGVTENKARSGSVIVLDAKTGEVLAMVNLPSYNPNNRMAKMTDVYRNRAVTDTFEPGSTIKPFSIASALETGRFTPNTIIDTTPGWIRLGKDIVRDEHQKGPMSITKILQISSNVGVTKMILGLPSNQLWNVLHRVGFGESTGVGFPGEQDGSLVKHDPWGQFTLASLAFGYGVSVTPLQLARAYNVLANQGTILPVSILRLDKQPEGTQVLKPKIAREMLTMLESVLQKGGTGEHATVPGYRVAGKTGTAVIAGSNGYQKHHYVSSFVGIAPVTNPRLVVVVAIHEPTGKQYYGGEVSGPVFSRVMEGALRILDVPPDDLATLTQPESPDAA